MDNIRISTAGIRIDDTLYPAEYSRTPKGAIVAFLTADNTPLNIRIEAGDANYPDALAAWETQQGIAPTQESDAPEAAETDDATPAQGSDAPEAAETDDATPSQASDAAPRETVDKPWIGSEIKGRGYVIVFDAVYERTRVIFKRPPSASVKEAVKAAGFYYSPTLKSWNKKLTCKAFRAAQALHMTLAKIA